MQNCFDVLCAVIMTIHENKVMFVKVGRGGKASGGGKGQLRGSAVRAPQSPLRHYGVQAHMGKVKTISAALPLRPHPAPPQAEGVELMWLMLQAKRQSRWDTSTSPLLCRATLQSALCACERR